MIIKTLVENTSTSEDFGSEHGLSLYIESKTHKLLFDTGASALFAENAEKMNVDLSDIDLAVISHGHYDHGGGLKAFLSVNNKAKVYLNKNAFEKHYSNRENGDKRYIGLDETLLANDRFIFVGKHLVIDDELELFSQVTGETLSPSGNQDLFMAVGQSIVPDDFSHEQNLIIKEDGKNVLVAGCAHKGIINILEHFRLGKGYLPSHVTGGFHLYNRAADKDEDSAIVTQIGEYLQKTGAKFYTCHCTGINSFNSLKSILGESVEYLSAGSQVIIYKEGVNKMSENCNQSCSSCGDDCAERKEPKNDFSEKLNELSNVKKVIGVVSGKGGVGKSLVTSMLAVSMNRMGYNSAILDADVTGPSIPKAFGIKGKAAGSELGLLPIKSKTGIDIMSINLLLENDTDPVVWRGLIIAGTVKQFWTDVIWNDVDFMFIDMPPGTGDVPLTVFQSIPVDGIIIVTSPQELVSMIVSKAVKMAKMMNIPIIGLVENMSYFKCPDNDKDYKIFGESHIEEIAEKHNIKVLAKLPIDPKISAACDRGLIELYDGTWLDPVAKILEKMEEKEMMKIAVASENGMVTEHFGHCEGFMIFDIENNQIVKNETIANPGHKPGFLPNFLNDMGVNVIISGGMGGGAIEIFNEKNIEVIVGASGNAKVAAEAYLQGSLKSTGSVCHEHQHHDECGE